MSSRQRSVWIGAVVSSAAMTAGMASCVGEDPSVAVVPSSDAATMTDGSIASDSAGPAVDGGADPCTFGTTGPRSPGVAAAVGNGVVSWQGPTERSRSMGSSPALSGCHPPESPRPALERSILESSGSSSLRTPA